MKAARAGFLEAVEHFVRVVEPHRLQKRDDHLLIVGIVRRAFGQQTLIAPLGGDCIGPRALEIQRDQARQAHDGRLPALAFEPALANLRGGRFVPALGADRGPVVHALHVDQLSKTPFDRAARRPSIGSLLGWRARGDRCGRGGRRGRIFRRRSREDARHGQYLDRLARYRAIYTVIRMCGCNRRGSETSCVSANPKRMRSMAMKTGSLLDARVTARAGVYRSSQRQTRAEAVALTRAHEVSAIEWPRSATSRRPCAIRKAGLHMRNGAHRREPHGGARRARYRSGKARSWRTARRA